MRTRSALVALAGLSALAFVRPPAAPAYSLIGGALDLHQRDVRVFDNFTDVSANDNTTAHPSFPGYTGAELALWVAVDQAHGQPRVVLRSRVVGPKSRVRAAHAGAQRPRQLKGRRPGTSEHSAASALVSQQANPSSPNAHQQRQRQRQRIHHR